jgi:hypothetical protein
MTKEIGYLYIEKQRNKKNCKILPSTKIKIALCIQNTIENLTHKQINIAEVAFIKLNA